MFMQVDQASPSDGDIAAESFVPLGLPTGGLNLSLTFVNSMSVRTIAFYINRRDRPD